ncbi:MAG TPA: AI-2E family transporter, partial [Pseudomonadales bacterium]|nr:AI-2E family transporter [Pseudomonadales bacterium]
MDSPVSRTVVTIAALFIIFAGLKMAEPIVNPFLLAIFFATLFAPPFMWLQRKKIPTPVALLIIIAGIFLVQTLVVAFVGSQLTAFRENLPVYQDHLNALFSGFPAYLKKFGIDIKGEDWTSYFDPNAAATVAGKLFSSVSGMLTNTFLILLTVIFILLEASSFPVKMRAIAHDPHASLLKFEKILDDIQNYMAIKTWMSILTGVAVSSALAIMGVGY